ncbi:MAG: hypothetical protein KJ597_02115 [Nanoarchaeota archaeon]|nr:hypothetical protein [Nanoarchaeota archaeon]MBU1622347.1 hypothetical protein [Nanoarchaeota archaeon]
MAKAMICNRIITKDGTRGYEAYVGQVSQILLPLAWVKKNIDFKGKGYVDWEY